MCIRDSLRCASKYAISSLNNQKFSGEGAQPPPQTSPQEPEDGGSTALLLLQCRREHCPTPDDVLSALAKQVAHCHRETAPQGRSALAEMLSRFFIRIFLFFFLNKSGVICKSRLATLTARRRVSGGICCRYNGVCLHAQNVRSMGRPPQTICARLDLSLIHI